MVGKGKWLYALLALLSGMAFASEPRFAFAPPAGATDAQLAKAVASLSREVLAAQTAGRVQVPGAGMAQLRMAARDDAGALGAVRVVIEGYRTDGDADRVRRWAPFLLLAQARAAQGGKGERAYAEAFERHFAGLGDLEAQRTQFWFGGDAERAKADLRASAAALDSATDVTLDEALGLARRQAFVDVLGAASASPALIAADEARRYLVDENVLIRTPDGATLSAVVVRQRKARAPLPAAMQFTIYSVPRDNRAIALQAAAHGYVGVVVDARGKRLSRDVIRPYETEAADATAAVEWAARQSWSDGRVAMYGGSYSGFAAWAATKHMPKALKAIAPYVAAMPGFGLPMENNVFISANYAWPFYVTNNRLLDDDTYSQHERWQKLPHAWYASGRPYHEIDQVDGTPNPWLQRWLSHPAFDAYWQAMVPYGEELARIDIPVLSITGYFDDGQVSALQYMKELLRHRPDADHTLLIGPYDHHGAQAPMKPRNVRGVDIDPVAQFDTSELTFQWFDHVLRGGPRPALLRDRVNYQLMGANEWVHVPSLEAAATPVAFYLSGKREGAYRLLSREPSTTRPLAQSVDFADRSTQGHVYFPDPAVRDALEIGSGFAFASEVFDQPASVVGTFSGELKVRMNKRDFDFSVSLYELKADDTVMQLSYYVGRASHARDMSRRELLPPRQWVRVPFERTRMTARQMAAGSRLLVVLDVLKDPNHQVNMGTGKDVSDESVADAAEPLTIEWHPDSVVRVPLRNESME